MEDELDKILNNLLWDFGVWDDLTHDQHIKLGKSILKWKDQAIKRELQSIVDKNHAKELGTYDYDGIAESVFEELTKRKEDK